MEPKYLGKALQDPNQMATFATMVWIAEANPEYLAAKVDERQGVSNDEAEKQVRELYSSM